MIDQHIRDIYRKRSLCYQKQGISFPGDKALGLEVDNGKCLHLLDSYMIPPVSVSRVFTTVTDMQNSVEIHVLQGKSLSAVDNKSLGKFLLSNIRPCKAGTLRLKILFQLNSESIFRVCAENLDTGYTQGSIIMKNPFGLTEKTMEADKLAQKMQRLMKLQKCFTKYIDDGLADELRDLENRTGIALRKNNYTAFTDLFIHMDILDREINSISEIFEGAYADN
ncbi:MAG: Hsp70 family protein [Spirochaetales bacterium]|nr:Hsp70 family protein [Spirochaetales bacterium]